MPRFEVFERQSITYAWLVDAEDADEAIATADGGVPAEARTAHFSSENYAVLVPGDPGRSAGGEG